MAESQRNLVNLSEEREERMMRRQVLPSSAYSKTIQIQSTGFSRQQESLKSILNDAQGVIRPLENRVQKIQPENLGVIRLNLLPNKDLKIPIDAVVERDGESFLARTIEIPLYGHGEDFIEAVDALKCEIESLYDDLMEDNNFTEEWLKIKKYLKTRIIDR